MISLNRKLCCLTFTLLAILLLLSSGKIQRDAAATSKGKASQSEPDTLDERNSFSGEAPQGTWAVYAIPAVEQGADTVSPVVVTATSSMSGRKQWGGFLKLNHSALKVQRFNTD
jgi:hypothetical protein